MWWLSLVEVGIFLCLAACVLWVFFKPVKKQGSDDDQ